MDSVTRSAPKLLAQHLQDAEPVAGGFRVAGLPLLFDRAWVQGTVTQKLAGALKVDDGTGSANVLLGLAAPQPGVDISGAKVGDYVLVIGKVVAKQHGGRQQLYIKPHKLINLSCDPEAAAQRMMHWNLEVLELHHLLAGTEAAAQA